MEKPDLRQDDLTEERDPTPRQREEAAHTLRLDPDIEEPTEPVKPRPEGTSQAG